jgi:hypothetical protein
VPTATLALALPTIASAESDDDALSLAVYGAAPYGCKPPTAAAGPDECPVGSVYTPGDNEWTDCQKSKEGGGVKNSAGEYVENVSWMQAGVMFVTVSIPGGSNNDDDLWNTGAFGAARSGPQIHEAAQRTAADLHWLDAAFAQAQALGARAVVIAEQADMWDLDGTGLGGRPHRQVQAIHRQDCSPDHGPRQTGAAHQRRLARVSLG